MADCLSYPSLVDFSKTVTILSGATVSNAIDIGGGTLVGLITPAALTSTAISFQSAPSLAGTYVACKDGAGSSISKTVAASQDIKIASSDLFGRQFLKLVAGTTEGADRIITLIIRPVS